MSTMFALEDVQKCLLIYSSKPGDDKFVRKLPEELQGAGKELQAMTMFLKLTALPSDSPELEGVNFTRPSSGYNIAVVPLLSSKLAAKVRDSTPRHCHEAGHFWIQWLPPETWKASQEALQVWMKKRATLVDINETWEDFLEILKEFLFS